MGVKKLDDLKAYQLAVAFKLEVYRVVGQSPHASEDLRYRGHLFEAASGGESNIAEGWHRYDARQIRLFLNYALGSLAEGRRRLEDGVHRKYFTADDVAAGVRLASRAMGATTRLRESLKPFVPPEKKKRPGQN